MQFGKLVEFFEFNNKIFAIIKKFKLIDHEEKIFFEFNRRFRDHLYKDLFLKFYRIVDIKQGSLEVVDCNDIILRCLLILNNKLAFVTELKYEFEHD